LLASGSSRNSRDAAADRWRSPRALSTRPHRGGKWIPVLSLARLGVESPSRWRRTLSPPRRFAPSASALRPGFVRKEAGMVDQASRGGDASSPALASRRTVNVLLGASFLSWMAVVLFPVLKYLKRPAEAAGRGETVVDEADKKKVLQNGFAIIRVGTDRVIIFQDAQKKTHALQAKCTHEGCTVAYKADEGLIWCACHNGKFAFDGRVISGPPPRPLAQFGVQGDLTGKLTVRREGA
jgi:cytochrome b6-f complex iron-sulfur subunit